MTATATFHVFIAALVLLVGAVLYSFVTDHAVPDDLLTDCAQGEVLDPTTMTCGGQ